MKSLLIGTNIYSHALKGDQETVTVLQQAKEIGICSISIGELLSGFKAGKREKKIERNWKNSWMLHVLDSMELMKKRLSFMPRY
jgi:predicted nucleic acid-binding protein